MFGRIFFSLLLLLSPVSAWAGEVRVAVAANFLATLQALEPVHRQQTKDSLRISSGSTGKLYAQIVHGAPIDVLLSADSQHPQRLVGQQLADENSRFVYASGQLVIWSRDPVVLDEKMLLSSETRRIAMANPATAPYGLAARQMLEKMGYWTLLQSKLVMGESVGQAFQFAATGNAQLGLVSLSQVLSPNNRYSRDYWRVPPSYYSPLEQQAVLLNRAGDNEAAKRFLLFLRSDEARAVMHQYGYL